MLSRTNVHVSLFLQHCSVPRQLIVEVFQKFSIEFDFYYSVFPAEERAFNRYAKGLNL